MRKIPLIFTIVIAIIFAYIPHVSPQEGLSEGNEEEGIEEEAPPPEEGIEAPEETPPEGAPEEKPTLPPAPKTPASPGLQGLGTEEKPEVEGGPVVGPLKMNLDAVVSLDYVFFNSTDTFKIKYHINLTGDISQKVGLIKTNATTVAEPSGYYAKWPTGQCILSINIGTVPCEIRYTKVGEKEVDLSFNFKNTILEDWESMCTFIDAPGRQFNTRGNPERWFDASILKATPSLKKVSVPISPDEVTYLKFTIPKHTMTDEGIGSAEIDGLGVITLKPEGAKGEIPELEGLTSSLRQPIKSREIGAKPVSPARSPSQLATRK